MKAVGLEVKTQVAVSDVDELLIQRAFDDESRLFIRRLLDMAAG